MVLTSGKGEVMVIMEKQDYTNKAQALLQDTNTYKVLNKDPTSRPRNKLIQTLKDINNLVESVTQSTGNCIQQVLSPKVYGLPKIHNVGTPSGPQYPVGVP